jgi:hypothetical protein
MPENWLKPAEIVLFRRTRFGYSPPACEPGVFSPNARFSPRQLSIYQPGKARWMFSGLDFSQLCVISSVQFCGILCAALSRITEGLRWQALFQRMFFGLLVVVAFTAVLNVWNSPQHWMMSATTLAVMVVTATCDFSRPI